MPASKYAHVDTKPLPSNIMDLRDEAFYGLIRQIAGKRLAELIAFQECNGVDSFLGCRDVTAILHLDSDELHDIKKGTCITLSDRTITLLPGLESSINNLTTLFKKKREEINRQLERLQSISTSALPISTITPSVLPTTASISHSLNDTHSSMDAPPPATPTNSSSIGSSTTHVPLTDGITSKISTAVVDWLKKNKTELNLTDMSFQSGVDFHLELNTRRDGIIFRCKCGTKCSLSQKRGILMVRYVTV